MVRQRRILATLALAACPSAPISAGNTPPLRAPLAAGVNRKSTPQIVAAVEGGAVEIKAGAAHVVRAVSIEAGVTLEVLDWGGSGVPVVLLAGLGNSAHIFDDFASAFLDHWRMLGVSRRGFGGSTVTAHGYGIPQLGSDILHALDALEVARAVFVGHSVAGDELNWLGSEHPERVLGLVYLDAAYDRVALRQHRPPPSPEPPATPADLASPVSYAAYMSRGIGMPIPVDEVLASYSFAPDGHFVGLALDPNATRQIAERVPVPDYTRVKVPALAVYALADHWTPDYAAYAAREREHFARALPAARVVVIPHSKHYLFLTNREEVVGELRGFLSELERPPG